MLQVYNFIHINYAKLSSPRTHNQCKVCSFLSFLSRQLSYKKTFYKSFPILTTYWTYN